MAFPLKVFTALMALEALGAQPYTRGVGVYPGDPRQDWSPTVEIDSTTYRNLALHRPAYQSSSYDYNLTAQLITDGIRETALPRFLRVTTSQQGLLPKDQRELLFDGNWTTGINMSGSHVWVQVERGGAQPPEIDRLDALTTLAPAGDNQEWTCILSASADGQSWSELGRAWGMTHPGAEIKPSIALRRPNGSRFYRIDFETGRPLNWRIAEISFSNANTAVHAGGPYSFSSAWMSAAAGEQWVSVDLGAPCSFDRIALYWIRRAAEGAIQISDDGRDWHTLQALPAAAGPVDDIHLASPAHARWVRLMLTKAQDDEPYILSELEVYGRGGPVPRAKPAAAATSDGRLPMAGGAWRLQRASLVRASGRELSTAGFQDSGWMIATVPATVLSSYLNDGAIPDPNYGDNQNAISDSFFYSDFWYRDQFTAPPAAAGRHVFLNFDGVNWKAEVFLNGQRLGRIDGGFLTGRFDVTAILRPGQLNALAVRIVKNANPGSVTEKNFQSPGKNGGVLGADNPTMHASIGWDWIPTIRGRDTGIWGDVYLTSTGAVSIENPQADTISISTDGSSAEVALEATLTNHSALPVSGKLSGRFGDAAFEQAVNIAPRASKTVKLDPAAEPALRLRNPKLWWPNGYGDPNLYRVELEFAAAGAVSDRKSFNAGVRRFTYSEEGGALRIWINGRRFVARGGNWGFPESMLRYRAREYDAAVRYHRDMNFTMIRNWVGQTGDEAFYDACDRFGIVVWQDFWLANPWDGPDPDGTDMFLANARDYVLRMRHHPSIGLYVGRNEGYPPDPIERGLRGILAELSPAIHYIPSSADDVVTGHGPYNAMPPRFYFAQRATTKLSSELGMPNIVTMDSLRAMMPEKDFWPQGDVWGMHDFSLGGAQRGASFRQMIDKEYGGATNVEDWVELAQFVNYDGYRAMFEAQGKNRMGVLLWMSHPCWPSFVWQTYDYYLDPTAGYFGAKKGSEPLHIQWDPLTDNVEVVNYSGGNAKGLTAAAEVLNMEGALAWNKTAPVDSTEDSEATPIHLEFPAALTPVHFIRLTLSRGDAVISRNFYLRGTEENDFRAIRALPKVTVEAATHADRQGSEWVLTTELHNASPQPALMVTVKAVRAQSGDRILPALYSDNYLALMPGERRTIVTRLEDADTRGERPDIVVGGFNVAAAR
ncbi:MAG: discoidin domain-containing protein [Bryobacteraceae bacterium]